MIKFCTEVVDVIRPLIQHEGNYDVVIRDLPFVDDEGKTIKKRGSHVRLKRIGKVEDELYSVTVYLNANVEDITSKKFAFFINRGFDIYLKNLGIELNQHTLLTLICLHEFGHVNMMMECMSNGNLTNFNSAVHVNDNATRMIFPTRYDRDRFVQHKDSLRYRYSFDENYADKFALIHFMNVWNQVKHLV